ncbi:hypothetical protein MJ560_22995 [Klebsiella pneumoniae]|nr:hypothetical protein MJ560_22995 [Klebsiella pneumoniae]
MLPRLDVDAASASAKSWKNRSGLRAPVSARRRAGDLPAQSLFEELDFTQPVPSGRVDGPEKLQQNGFQPQ